MVSHPPLTVELLTGPGRSAIAVVRVSGELAWLDRDPPLFRAVNERPVGEQRMNTICFGVWGDEPAEDIVFCRTGTTTAEICCHGGLAAVERIVLSLEQRGFVRSSASGVDNLWTAVTRARTERTAELLLEQTGGLFDREIARIEKLPIDRRRPPIEALLRELPFARHLTTAWDVVLCGRPNVGKSSLMNAIAGFTRSIVSAEAGTTRDLVTLETALEGWPIRLTDSAGVRETEHPLEQEGIRRTRHAITASDLALILLDTSQPLTVEDQELLALPDKRFVILHKCDLPRSAGDWPPEGIPVSSSTGEGVAELLARIARELVPSPPKPGTALPVTQAQQGILQQMWRDL